MDTLYENERISTVVDSVSEFEALSLYENERISTVVDRYCPPTADTLYENERISTVVDNNADSVQVIFMRMKEFLLL